jgi:hypothetical protein
VEAKSLGQIAYDAYGEHLGWITFAGAQMVSWQSQRPDIKAAWEQAGRSVAIAVTRARQATELAAVETQDTARDHSTP